MRNVKLPISSTEDNPKTGSHSVFMLCKPIKNNQAEIDYAVIQMIHQFSQLGGIRLVNCQLKSRFISHCCYIKLNTRLASVRYDIHLPLSNKFYHNLVEAIPILIWFESNFVKTHCHNFFPSAALNSAACNI